MSRLIVIQESELKEFMEGLMEDVLERFLSTQKVEQPKEEKLYNTQEACELLRCSKPTLHRWKQEGIIPHVRIGVNIRYRKSDLDKLINK